MAQIEELTKRVKGKREQVQVLDSCDSRRVDDMQIQVYTMREAANRWADNIYILKEYILANKPDCSHEDLAIQFRQLADQGMIF